jgi:ferredoxin
MPRVSIAESDKTFEVKEGSIIYDALFEQGLDLPHGCLSGSCGACRILVLKGEENLQAVGVIEQNTIDSLKAEYKRKNHSPFLSRQSQRRHHH